MPPRRGDDNMTSYAEYDDPAVAVTPPTDGSNIKKKKKRSSKHRTNGGSSGKQQQPEDDDNDDDDRQLKERQSKKKEQQTSKKKSGGDSKKKSKKKSSSASSGNGIPSQNGLGGVGEGVVVGGGVTVSRFRRQQQSMQDEASSRKNAATARQRTMMMASDPSAITLGGEMQQSQQTFEIEAEGEAMHNFDDDDSDDPNIDERERGAVVPRGISGNTVIAQHPDNRPPHESNPQNLNPHQHKFQVVDTIPADHPSSSIIQTHRTCSLCHRTLPRSQFSERDRFSVNLSLAPGLTCRTCAMTVSAVRLKSMPGTEQLLLEYAQRGMQQGMMALGAPPQAPVAGYLEGSPSAGANNNNALVVREDSAASWREGSYTGNELTLYGAWINNDPNNPNNNGGNGNIMGMAQDVNSAFSGTQYGHDDTHRPTSVADCKYIDALLSMPCYLNLNAFGLFTSSRDVSVSLAALEAVRLYGTMDRGYFRAHDCDGMPVSQRKKGAGRGNARGEGNDADINGDGRGGEESNNVDPKSIVCIVLGEGSAPRTAVLASQHYGWTSLSVDPDLGEEWEGYHDDIPGFTGYSGSISNFMNDGGEFAEGVVEYQRQQGVQHLVIVCMQHEKDVLRLRGNGHINSIRNRYEDVPTTLVSLSPVRKATLAPQRRTGQCGSKLEKDVGYEPNCSYIDEGVFSACRQVEVWNFHNAEDDGSDDEGEGYEDEEGYDGKEGARSDRVVKKKKNSETAAEAAAPSFEEQIQRLGGKKKLQKETKPVTKKGVKKNQWLEDRVAQFKKEKDSGCIKDDQAELYNGMDSMLSLSTLSTKGTLERLPSSGNKLVISFGDSMKEQNDLDDGSDRSDDDDGVIRREAEERLTSGEERLVVNHPDKNNDYDRDDEYSEQREDEHPTLNAAPDDEEEGIAATWSQPDDEDADKVWEKALAKHEDAAQESLVNHFEDYYASGSQENDGRRHQEEYDQDSHQEDNNAYQGDGVMPENPQDGLPPSWEAIHDMNSDEYYYSNWETGEVTWDRPACHPEGSGQARLHSEPFPVSSLENGEAEENDEEDDYSRSHSVAGNDGHHQDSSYDEKLSSAAAVSKATNDNNDPPLAQQGRYEDGHRQHSFGTATSDNSNYVFDDQSSASSGIAALSRWNKLSDNTTSPTLDNSKADAEEEDDMIVWSDDEEATDHFDADAVGRQIQRSVSSTSSKRQPWHREDSDEVTGHDDDSFFIYD